MISWIYISHPDDLETSQLSNAVSRYFHINQGFSNVSHVPNNIDVTSVSYVGIIIGYKREKGQCAVDGILSSNCSWTLAIGPSCETSESSCVSVSEMGFSLVIVNVPVSKFHDEVRKRGGI